MEDGGGGDLENRLRSDRGKRNGREDMSPSSRFYQTVVMVTITDIPRGVSIRVALKDQTDRAVLRGNVQFDKY